MSEQRIAVIGCGGIGGTLAAALARAGRDVVPVTGNVLIAEALARDGFRVREFEGEAWSLVPPRKPRVRIGDDGGGRFDLVVVATQSPTLEAALADAREHLADGGAIVVCQNGLPEERAARVVGSRRVVGCIVGYGASMTAPGVYVRTSKGTLVLGRPTQDAPDPAPVAALFDVAAPASVTPDLAPLRWSKLAINCVTSTLGATSGLPLGALLAHRFARRLALEVFAEVAAVARAAGVRPAPLSGTLDIEKVAITDEERRLRLGSPSLAYKHSILLAVGFKYRRLRSSMLYALERGRPPEIDFLNGEVVRRGERLGVATPVNAALVDAIRDIAAAGGRGSSLERLRAVYEATLGAAVARAA